MTRLKSNPALFIIDMQNASCDPSGTFGKLGLPVSRHQAVIPAINHLRTLCHARGIPVFYTELSFKEDYSDAGIIVEIFPGLSDLKGFIRGTWDAQIVDDLKPTSSETLILKTRNTAFWGTGLDKILAEQGINQIIATGVGTNMCVESTVRDAITYGFYALTVSDATATSSDEEQQSSLINLRGFGGVISSKELEDELHAL